MSNLAQPLTQPKPYLMNAWYVAALSTEVDAEALFHRTLLDTPVLIYRKKGSGEPVAMLDRCPHRFLPLHMGDRDGDKVTCKYHGLQFDCDGACTHNPHGNQHIPAAATVPSFTLRERNGLIWIWMGDAPADEAKLHDFSPLTEGPESGVGYTHIHVKCNYKLILDNVMDLSHIDHVHGEIITTRGQLSPLVPQVRPVGDAFAARWEWSQTPAMMIFAGFLPDPKAAARHFFDITYLMPGNIQLSVGATQDAGAPLDLVGTTGQYDLHTVTPETNGSTHYFFVTRRNHNVDDAEFNQFKIDAMRKAFVDEDVPLAEAVQERMGVSHDVDDFFSMSPVLMSNDVAAVRMRRTLEAAIVQEQTRTAASGKVAA